MISMLKSSLANVTLISQIIILAISRLENYFNSGKQWKTEDIFV